MEPEEAQRLQEVVFDPTSSESLLTFRESQRLLHDSYKHLSTLAVGTAVAAATIASVVSPETVTKPQFIMGEVAMLTVLSLAIYRLFRVPFLLQQGNAAALVAHKRAQGKLAILWWNEAMLPVTIYGIGVVVLTSSLWPF